MSAAAKAEPRNDVKRMSDAEVVEAYLTASMIPDPEAASAYMKPGTIITWTNHDNFTHSVQVHGQPAGVDANVHMVSPGQSTQITFDQPGTYQYVCTLHTQNMKGTVVVDSA